MAEQVEQWGIFEASFSGPDHGNPFLEVRVGATFQHLHRRIRVDGFYDGEGVYRVRFMPDVEGEWTFVTDSNQPRLDGQSGQFTCIAPSPANHGPVRASDQYHFAYSDGTHFTNIGTTCYAWTHQDDELIAQTLATLPTTPFNKIRMGVMPKSFEFNENEPPLYPFPIVRRGNTRWAKSADGVEPITWQFDFDRFEPDFFWKFETHVADMRNLGIEADVILFHPYDRWGFASMPPDVDDRYLRYVCARLSAYRNVWWSLANEWDLLRDKTVADWERFARIVREHDPYDHLRSIHQYKSLYDHGKAWVTHVSYQGEPSEVTRLRNEYGKPVVVDECAYEGDIGNRSGNLSPEGLTYRFWLATCLGGYCGHGEMYLHPQERMWWSKGGVLRGQSPQRIAFLREIIEQGAGGYEPYDSWHAPAVRRGEREALIFTQDRQPRYLEAPMPGDGEYALDLINPWAMTIEPLPGRYSGVASIPLPVRPYLVIRARKV